MSGEIRIDHAPVVNAVIEYRRKGSGGEWRTWIHLDEDDTENWVHRKLGKPDSRDHLEFRLLRRTALITDEVLDTEGE